MKIHKVVACCCVLLVGNAGAQVGNDDCANALVLNPAQGTGQCVSFGLPGFALPIVDSTDAALADFPYPISPLNCQGYPGYGFVAANDMWYKSFGRWGYAWSLESADTCHLTIWAGGGCSNLQPLYCYALANGTASGSLCGFYPTDTIYLQVSNKAIGASPSSFRLCFTSACPSFMGASFDYSAPTPEICSAHTITTVACTGESASDGEIHVAVTAGNGPFSILWDEGGSDFDRYGLSPGEYSATLTDAQGCSEQLTAKVGFDVVTRVHDIQRETPRALVVGRDQGMLLMPLPTGWELREIRLFTISGELIKTRQITTQGHLDVSGLSPGTYILCGHPAGGAFSTLRLVIL